MMGTENRLYVNRACKHESALIPDAVQTQEALRSFKFSSCNPRSNSSGCTYSRPDRQAAKQHVLAGSDQQQQTQEQQQNQNQFWQVCIGRTRMLQRDAREKGRGCVMSERHHQPKNATRAHSSRGEAVQANSVAESLPDAGRWSRSAKQATQRDETNQRSTHSQASPTARWAGGSRLTCTRHSQSPFSQARQTLMDTYQKMS